MGRIGDLVSASAVIGKTLIAKRDIPVYIAYPTRDEAVPIGIIKSGNPCGVVYSYSTDSDGTTLWNFLGGTGISQQYYLLQHRAGNFALSDLRQQGVITVYEAILKAEEEKKKADESIVDKAQSTIEKLGIAAIVVWGLSKIFSNYNSSR